MSSYYLVVDDRPWGYIDHTATMSSDRKCRLLFDGRSFESMLAKRMGRKSRGSEGG
jgi:hypothetical protein